MLTKNLGGRIVALTPEEEAATRAEWAANDARPVERPRNAQAEIDELRSTIAALKKDEPKAAPTEVVEPVDYSDELAAIRAEIEAMKAARGERRPADRR